MENDVVCSKKNDVVFIVYFYFLYMIFKIIIGHLKKRVEFLIF